jgi:hypothetical protein
VDKLYAIKRPNGKLLEGPDGRPVLRNCFYHARRSAVWSLNMSIQELEDDGWTFPEVKIVEVADGSR